nr:coatomer subunit beta-1 [Tanacetum cinerariifolium]
IVRYVLPSEDHTVQKLLIHYLEIIKKTDSKGKVLPKMILICKNLRNNLEHLNGYIRGVTLRFLCRICKAEIIEPLISSILANLEHQLPFVRRNAILAVSAIYKLPKRDQLLVDALKMIEKCRAKKREKEKYITIIISLLNAPSAAVILECVGTLVFLSSAPTATRAATNAYCKLLLN